jgi:hypothetical protein
VCPSVTIVRGETNTPFEGRDTLDEQRSMDWRWETHQLGDAYICVCPSVTIVRGETNTPFEGRDTLDEQRSMDWRLPIGRRGISNGGERRA